MTATVIVTARGAERVRCGHPWVYQSDLREIDAEPATTVAVVDPRGRRLGEAFYSDRSQIALRMVTRGDERMTLDVWRARLNQAAAFRASLGIDATAYRLVHGEADLLPAFTLDRYGDHLVVQATAQAVDRMLPQVVPLLVDLFRPRGILARNDGRVRLKEGLEREVALLDGEVPPLVEIREGGEHYEVDLWKGQKTGLFLDQRENRAAAAQYARGRALDCFTYNGGFALRLARHCDQVLAIDISEDACARVRANAARNGIANLDVRAANVFDELHELDRGGEAFDTIVLDPPAFAKTRAVLDRALKGYKEINLRALKLLRPGGCLVTCTCSYHVDESMFGEVVYGAALDAGAVVTVVEKRMQGRDHPVLLGVPESYYLKCFILRRLA